MEAAGKEAPGLLLDGKSIGLFDLLRMPAKEAPESLEAQLLWIRDHWGAKFRRDRVQGPLQPRPDRGGGEAQVSARPRPRRRLHLHPRRATSTKNSPRTGTGCLPPSSSPRTSLSGCTSFRSTTEPPSRGWTRYPSGSSRASASRGINALWLIGIWKRSAASEKIKRACGNPRGGRLGLFPLRLRDRALARRLGGPRRAAGALHVEGDTARRRHGSQPHGHRLRMGE